MALVLGAVDRPSTRKVHTKVIARFGGLSIYLSFLAAVVIGLMASPYFNIRFNPRSYNALLGVLIGGGLMTAIGLADDMRSMPALLKLAGQIVASCIALYFGLHIYFLSTPFAKLVILGAWAPLVTVIWMVGITNAMNLIDGLDGLATGITLIAADTLFAVALKMGQTDAAIVLCALCGVCLAFLGTISFRHRYSWGILAAFSSGSLWRARPSWGYLKALL